MDAFARQRVPDPPHEATERLIARGPENMMDPVDEEAGKTAALESAVNSAAEAGLSSWGVGDLRGFVLMSILRVIILLLQGGAQEEVAPTWLDVIDVNQNLIQTSMDQSSLAPPLFENLDEGKGRLQQQEAKHSAPAKSVGIAPLVMSPVIVATNRVFPAVEQACNGAEIMGASTQQSEKLWYGLKAPEVHREDGRTFGVEQPNAVTSSFVSYRDGIT